MRRLAPTARRLLTILLGLLAALYGGLLGLRVFYPIDYTIELRAFARELGLDPALVAAVVRCESRFDPQAVSRRGAIGLMQIMPETGAWIATQLAIRDFDPGRLTDPAFNLRLGAWYLHHLLDRFGSPRDALAAYNAGPSHAERWAQGLDDPFPETSAYVRRVMRSVPVYRFYLAVPWLLEIVPPLLISRCDQRIHGLDSSEPADVTVST